MYIADFDSSQTATAAEMSMNFADADVMTDAVKVAMIESDFVVILCFDNNFISTIVTQSHLFKHSD